jgi:pimeloyl-ACP methyl ester carboxylesterase
MTDPDPVFTTADAHGQRFVFADSGAGPLVVLIHGFPDTPHGWLPSARALNDAGYRTVVPYLRGYHPDTIVAGRRYGGGETGEDAIRLLDALEAESAVLVGHDWGASVTYRAAAMAPDRVRAFCAVAIPHPRMLKPSVGLAWHGRHFLTLRVPTGPWLARRNDFSYMDALIRRWAPNWSGPERERTLRDVKRAFADPRVLDAALSYYRDVSAGGLGNLSQPALLVGGGTDIVPTSLFERSRTALDGPADVFIIEHAGHWPHRESAERFNERLLSFLASL